MNKKKRKCKKRGFWEKQKMMGLKDWQKVILWQKGEIRGHTTDYNVCTWVREYLFVKYNYQCAECGWSKVNRYSCTRPLEVHHINGDRQNSSEENLILLCPNCHALTSTYRGWNRNKQERETDRLDDEQAEMLV